MNGRSKRRASYVTAAAKLGCDAVLLTLAFGVATVAASAAQPIPEGFDHLVTALAVLIPVKIVGFHLFGAYRSIWRYTSVDTVKELVFGAAAGEAAIWSLVVISGWSLIESPLLVLIDAVLGFLLVAGLRVAVRIVQPALVSRRRIGPRALIVGAGDAGEMIVREMRRRGRIHFDPVGFVDDDVRKSGHRIHGIRVLGATHDIPRLVDRLRVETVVIAIPSASPQTLRRIVCACRRTRADVKILPDLGGLMDSSVGLSRLRPLEVLDLLGRAPSASERCPVTPRLEGKCVLVTGAGGSIGSELCRQILRFAPASLIMLGRGENSIHQVYHDLAPIAGRAHLVQVIGDVINKRKLARVFEKHRPDVVFHAAADKHVPLMELYPDEAVLNNVIGTRNLLELADAWHCEKVVCISSDKAVRPTSVMGCTKRVAELLIRSPLYPNTRALAVRFGNVFGSRGSVIPRFQDQIEDGGPLTVTDKGISRYFMTIPEAVGLVLVAGAMGRGREIYVLDMGAPVRIWDLAAEMARFRGLEPGVDIELKETGLRPGEKLHEELFLDDELCEPTPHPRITRTLQAGVDPRWLRARIDVLHELALSVDLDGVREELGRLVRDVPPARTSDLRSDLRPATRRPLADVGSPAAAFEAVGPARAGGAW